MGINGKVYVGMILGILTSFIVMIVCALITVKTGDYKSWLLSPFFWFIIYLFLIRIAKGVD